MSLRPATLALIVLVPFAPAIAPAQEAAITVHADRTRHRLSKYLTGACIEDVNHEIYGGLYSQLVFGESFQEPAPPPRLKGFTAYGGRWVPRGDALDAAPGDGPKLIAETPALGDGKVSVDVFLPGDRPGNAGLILKVRDAAVGADRWTGYEVSFESRGRLVLGRHRQNWEPLADVPCAVGPDRWVNLAVRFDGRSLTVRVDGREVLTFTDPDHPLPAGRIGLRTWQRPARFRNLTLLAAGASRTFTFTRVEPEGFGDGVSGMWRATRTGSARGTFALESAGAFVGSQSQRLTFDGGDGSIGVENQGLNRWGMSFVAGKPYEGHVWARADQPAPLTVALESRDGSKRYAETRVEVPAGGWKRFDFTLTPKADDPAGRLTLALTRPGSLVLGYAFLQPGEWGRFKGLPDRKDVAEGLVDQGLTVLRYGGSMVNHPAYRWKNMTGPRDRRPPTAGTWYPYSTNGWGIPDFLNVCEAAGFLGIPAFNANETPRDMADFVEYANGPADSLWGRKRVEDGHPAPYRLRHVEIGNEEAVNEDYWRRFRPIAEAVWAKDPEVILVVGDFAYNKVITDPYKFEGGAVVNTLAAHEKILKLAKEHGREVWFDIHVWTDHPPEPYDLRNERSYIDQLTKLARGAKFKVPIFEFNSGNHAMKRALSNALGLQAAQRVGDAIPVVCVANCLQPDGQNDNGWDQGMLFLNPSRVWLQPPGYVTRMIARNDQPFLVESTVENGGSLDVTATRSEDGKTLVLKVVNPSAEPRPVSLSLNGFTPSRPEATVETLSGPLDAANTAKEPDHVRPVRSTWSHHLGDGKGSYTFAPHSFTVLRLE